MRIRIGIPVIVRLAPKVGPWLFRFALSITPIAPILMISTGCAKVAQAIRHTGGIITPFAE
jgi:hypothetical protein